MNRRSQSTELTTAEVFDQYRADYQAARSNRWRRSRTGLPSFPASGDWHLRSESQYLSIIEYSRDFFRNDSIIAQAVNRAVDNIIQDGIQPDPQTGDKELDNNLTSRWNDWASDPEQVDLSGERSWHEIERIVPVQVLVDGDMVILPTRNGTLQMAEAHRIRTPKNAQKKRKDGSALVYGVLLDKYRRRKEFWITKEDVDPWSTVNKVSDMHRYPVRDADGNRQVFHVYNPNTSRISLTRGMSAFAPIFDLCGMFEDLNFSMLVKAQVSSAFAIFREREEQWQAAGDVQTGERETETMPDGSTRTIEGIGPGIEYYGAPGEKLQGFSPNVPNPEFFEHVKLLLTLIGINLGLPLVMVTLNASDTTYSSFRGAVSQAQFGFRKMQRHLVARLHRPVYLWQLRRWLADDPALMRASQQPKINIFRHRWTFPVWPYIEPLKDASADLLRVRNALTSPRRIQQERGRDWEEVSQEIVTDNGEAIRKAKEMAAAINGDVDDGQPVHWRELLSLPTPDGVKVKLSTDSESGQVTQQQPQEEQ